MAFYVTLYKILDSKVHPIISKDNQRLPKTAKARLVFPDAYNGEWLDGYISVHLNMHKPCGSTSALSFFYELFIGSI